MSSAPGHRFPILPLMFIIFGCFLPGTACAGITLDSMHAYLAPNRSTGELTVYNMSPTTAYVRVDVIEMTVKGDELNAVPGELGESPAGKSQPTDRACGRPAGRAPDHPGRTRS